MAGVVFALSVNVTVNGYLPAPGGVRAITVAVAPLLETVSHAGPVN